MHAKKRGGGLVFGFNVYINMIKHVITRIYLT